MLEEEINVLIPSMKFFSLLNGILLQRKQVCSIDRILFPPPLEVYRAEGLELPLILIHLLIGFRENYFWKICFLFHWRKTTMSNEIWQFLLQKTLIAWLHPCPLLFKGYCQDDNYVVFRFVSIILMVISLMICLVYRHIKTNMSDEINLTIMHTSFPEQSPVRSNWWLIIRFTQSLSRLSSTNSRYWLTGNKVQLEEEFSPLAEDSSMRFRSDHDYRCKVSMAYQNTLPLSLLFNQKEMKLQHFISA